MDRVFLDANVLFSAAYREHSGLRRLWELERVQLVTSGYAAAEAHRNLPEGEPRMRLESLLAVMEVSVEVMELSLPTGVDLPAKDRPIQLAALHARATHLLTGDVAHFGPYFGRSIEGVQILRPAEYLRSRPR
ncbi:MAG: DNA-binding protein [Gemmatimonadetes bacterium]|nr:DNA-binding protein [Gemmatimonadota bacterium]